MVGFGFTIPNNELPQKEYEKVRIVNKTKNVTFSDYHAKNEPSRRIEISLKPNQYCFVPKYVAKHWFGDWEAEPSEWAKEVRRLSVRYGIVGDPKNKLSDLWKAIQEKEIYVEGYTDSSINYTSHLVTQSNPNIASFDLDAPIDPDLKRMIDLNSPGHKQEDYVVKTFENPIEVTKLNR